MKTLTKIAAFTLSAGLPLTSAAGALAEVPLFLITRAPSNVLFDLSIEWPTAGAAYNDQPDTDTGCTGRAPAETVGTVTYNNIGTCYFRAQAYLGYFDPDKCYSYDNANGQFEPFGAASTAAGSEHQCLGTSAGKWSGNLLNWVTMSAIDEFRHAVSGGHRVTDSATDSVLERTNLTNNGLTGNPLVNGSSVFPIKKLSSALNENPGTVTPYTAATVYIQNHGVQLDVGSQAGGTNLAANQNVRVKVCDPAAGLETNCKAYGSSYKPDGLIQEYGDRMRFGVISYLLDNAPERDGGVLRSKIKATGVQKYDPTAGLIDNPNKEWNPSDGSFYLNPDPTEAGASGVANSGVINTINKFGANGYKSKDPIGELYYEAVRYFKNLGPTPAYSAGATAAMLDGFPAITTWDDPMQFSCQKNFIIGINDANPWDDKKLPGTFFTSSTLANGTALAANDYGEPSNPDAAINVRNLTNTVGDLEGLNGTVRCIGGDTNSYDGVTWPATAKLLPNLGEVLGTCPSAGKQNSYYIAGLAYYANTNDLRTDLTGSQTISTFFLDTQEYTANPLLGQMNMLWLAGKYGGFVDRDNNQQPNLASEWDADNDGQPDNYVLANKPEKMITGLTKAFAQVEQRSPSAASVAANSSSFNDNTRIYQGKFNSADWSGTVLGYAVSSGVITPIAGWDAGNVLKPATTAPNTRVIYTVNDTPANRDGVLFLWANLSTGQQAALNTNAAGDTDTNGSGRLDYLRGDNTAEGTGAGKYRPRSTPLGDIINSAPVYVGKPTGGYSDSAYATFRNTNLNREPMVYVGANDGMLHGFSATTGTDKAKERIAYVPSALFTKLSKLTSQTYTHTHYVDGTPSVADAQINNTWKTVLAGGLRGGGQGIYALDVTNPATFTADATGASNTVLWEFTDKDDADLGFSFSEPQIVKMHDGKWWVLIGNGYNNTQADGSRSTSGHAVFYLLRLEGPGGTNRSWRLNQDYFKFDTLAGTAGTPNGLATPTAIDTDFDTQVDYIYSGDLLGNLWKLNVSNTSPGNWGFGFGTTAAPNPLFAATDGATTPTAQAITAQAEVIQHPQGGFVVLFGTGKYLETSDTFIPYTTQSFYGIRDKNDGATVSRSNLLQQTLVQAISTTGTEYLITSANQPTATQLGWYLNLQNSGANRGERVIFKPSLRNRRVLFTSLIPNADVCGTLGSGFLYILDAVTGSRTVQSAFDTDNNLKFNNFDDLTLADGTTKAPASGIRKGTWGIISTPAVTSSGAIDYNIINGTGTGTDGSVTEPLPTAGVPRGRLSWREIIRD